MISLAPPGFGTQGFIQPNPLPYQIDYQNDPTKATAAVQVVTVTEDLDPNFDLSTFQFTGFGFGSNTFTVPAGLSHYQTTIDLRPDGIDLLVPVTLDLNQSTGLVTATFQSLDPATGLPPDGVNDGFLPIDDAQHDGVGFFTYTVSPKAGLSTGATINNQASVVFDTNAPLATPTTLNTIDTGINLTTSVTALPAVSPGSFTLSWSGTDTGGSGIASYSIYYSDNGGPLTPFLLGTTQTSATFVGLPGHTYTFDNIATDNVGNVQPIPATPQATTVISMSAASHVAITSKLPAKITAGSSFSITVEALNNSGKVDPLFNGVITLTLPGQARLAGPTTVVASAGVATFTGLTIDTAGSGYTLQVNTLVLATGTSSSFSVTPGAGSQLVVTTEPPASVAANAPFSVAIAEEDAFGNVVSTFSGKVGLTLSGGGKLLGNASKSAVGGVATFSGLMIDTAATGYSLKAISGRLTGLSTRFAVTPLTATKLVVTTPANVTAGVPFTVTVSAEDNFGNVDPTFTGSVGLSLSGNGSLSGPTSMNAGAGVAVFSGLSISAAGTVDTLQVSSSLPSVITGTFNVAALQSDQLVITTEPASSITAGSKFTIVVKAENGGQVDTHFSGAITLGLAGPGRLAGTATVTVRGGVATFAGLAIDTAGTGFSLLASSVGLTPEPTSSFAVTASTVTHLVVSTPPPGSVAAGGIFGLTVSAEDAFGNVNPTFAGTIKLALSHNPTRALLNGMAIMPASAGVAAFTGLGIDAAASGYVLTATSGRLAATTGSLTVTAGTAMKLVMTTSPPASLKAGSAFTVTIKAEDQYGNVDPTFTGSVNLTLANSAGSVGLHGPITVAPRGGVAVFTGVLIDTAGSGYTLTASSGSLAAASSKSITVTPGAATRLAVTSQPPSTVMAGAGFGLTVAVEDAFGNVVTNFTGSISLTLSGGNGPAHLSGTSTKTVKAGVAAFAGLSILTAATGYVIKATAHGVTATSTDGFDIAT